MKYFNCGQCGSPYKMDTSNIKKEAIGIKCRNCGARNVLRLGPVLVLKNEKETKQYPLRIGSFTIGRLSEPSTVDFAISDEYISRKHLNLEVKEINGKLAVLVSDCGSTNGTFNKNKVQLQASKFYPLRESDFIIIGLTKVFFRAN